MSPPETRRGRPADSEAPPNTDNIGRRHSADTTTNSNTRDHTALSVVAALAFPPSHGRRLTLAVVVGCPFCSTPAVVSVHAHRAVTDGDSRLSGCRRGRYTLRVVPGVVA